MASIKLYYLAYVSLNVDIRLKAFFDTSSFIIIYEGKFFISHSFIVKSNWNDHLFSMSTLFMHE